MNTLSTITILPSNKEEISIYCQQAKEEILAGDYDPLMILKQLKAFELVLDTLLKDPEIKHSFMNAAEKYGEKTFEHIGCKFQVKNAAARYDYSNCQDSEYNLRVQKVNAAKEDMKAREKYLQSLKDAIIDQETGEAIYPPLKTQETIVSVTLL